MSKTTNKKNALTGYLLLFLVFQGIDLLLAAIELIRYSSVYYSIVSFGGEMWAFFLIIVCLPLVSVILPSLIIFLFLRRKRAFIKIYIVSAVYSILLSIFIIGMLTWFMIQIDSFEQTKLILGIILQAVMLYFWLGYFKSSTDLKVYLNSGSGGKMKSGKHKRAKSRLRIVK